MRIREIFRSRLAGLLGVEAIVLYPFILYRSDKIQIGLRRHEWQHVIQVRRDGVLKFYLKYLWEYVAGRLKGMSHHDAYENISYEIEARLAQDDGQRPWEED